MVYSGTSCTDIYTDCAKAMAGKPLVLNRKSRLWHQTILVLYSPMYSQERKEGKPISLKNILVK